MTRESQIITAQVIVLRKQGMSQKEIAQKVGLSQSSVSARLVKCGMRTLGVPRVGSKNKYLEKL